MKNVAQDEANVFFTTNTFRFILLTICSFGLYQLYWFYKNWLYIKNNIDADVSPFWRTFFYPFWAYIIFNEINKKAESVNYTKKLPTGICGFLYFLSYFLSFLPNPYALVYLLTFFLIIPFNNAAVFINEVNYPDFKNNTKLTIWNWSLVIFSCIVWGIFFFDLFFPLDVNNKI